MYQHMDFVLCLLSYLSFSIYSFAGGNLVLGGQGLLPPTDNLLFLILTPFSLFNLQDSLFNSDLFSSLFDFHKTHWWQSDCNTRSWSAVELVWGKWWVSQMPPKKWHFSHQVVLPGIEPFREEENTPLCWKRLKYQEMLANLKIWISMDVVHDQE